MWDAPILFQKKNDGIMSICVNYRGLKKSTIKNKYPLPILDELVNQLSRAKKFSEIDLKIGCNEIRGKDSDIKKTFHNRFGHYEYLVIPLGLTNAPDTFMNIMNIICKEYLGVLTLVFMNDILVYS